MKARKPYESLLKAQLEDRLKNAPDSYRDLFAEALHNLDHTDPARIRDLLPPDALAFYQMSALRAQALAPLIEHSHESRCFIESIVLDHGLAQLALRALFVMAWQRTIMPTSLTPQQLAPYYADQSRAASVRVLVELLEDNGVLQAHQTGELRWLNEVRNQAAHGVIFGEISPAGLETTSLRALGVASRAVGASAMWFSNPRPLRSVPGGTKRKHPR